MCTPLHILYIMYAYRFIDIHIRYMMLFIFFYFIYFLCYDIIFTNYAASVGRFCPPLNYIRQGRAPPDSSRCRSLSRAHKHSHSNCLSLSCSTTHRTTKSAIFLCRTLAHTAPTQYPTIGPQ